MPFEARAPPLLTVPGAAARAVQREQAQAGRHAGGFGLPVEDQRGRRHHQRGPVQPAGLLFDQALIVLILVSLAVVVADSVESLQARWGGVFEVLEWTFTLLFTLEYLLRLACGLLNNCCR